MQFQKISVENAEFQVVEALKKNRHKRSSSGEVFIEGIEAFKQALASGVEITRVLVRDYEHLSRWAQETIGGIHSGKLFEISEHLYGRLCDRDEPVELLATCRAEVLELRDLKLPHNPLVVIFDRPSDHGNFGSLVRSANSFGVDAILVVGHAIDVYDPRVIRASLGALFHTKLARVSSTNELAAWFEQQKKQTGLRVVGSDSNGELSLADATTTRPVALVLGNEAKGMSVALRGLCDEVVRIPIEGAVNSLNVACAGTVLLWEIYRNGLKPGHG